jgi:hypothetical protein
MSFREPGNLEINPPHICGSVLKLGHYHICPLLDGLSGG